MLTLPSSAIRAAGTRASIPPARRAREPPATEGRRARLPDDGPRGGGGSGARRAGAAPPPVSAGDDPQERGRRTRGERGDEQRRPAPDQHRADEQRGEPSV